MGILFAVSVVPAVILLSYVFRKDRLEREPAALRWKLLILGALSCIPAVLLEELGTELLSDVEDTLTLTLLDNFLVVALAEEFCKYVLLRKATWKHPAFNCSYDGLLYAVYIALGFATLENIFYVFSEGLDIGLIRAITSVPGHCFDGVFMGVLYARAKEAEILGNRGKKRRFLRRALWIPVLSHGMYDFLLSLENDSAVLIFLGFLIVLYIFGFKLIRKASKEDHFLETEQKENTICR